MYLGFSGAVLTPKIQDIEGIFQQCYTAGFKTQHREQLLIRYFYRLYFISSLDSTLIIQDICDSFTSAASAAACSN